MVTPPNRTPARRSAMAIHSATLSGLQAQNAIVVGGKIKSTTGNVLDGLTPQHVARTMKTGWEANCSSMGRSWSGATTMSSPKSTARTR